MSTTPQQLLDYDWLSAQLAITDIKAVIAHYDQFPDDEAIQLVRNALHLSEYVLAEYPDQLPTQLTGRLWVHRHKVGIADLYASASAKSAWQWGENLPNSPLESAGSGLLHILKHSAVVRCMAYSPDKKRIATGTDDGNIWIWDAPTGELIHTYSGHQGMVKSLSWDESGRVLASGGVDSRVCIWDTHIGEQIRMILGHAKEVNVVAFDKSAGRLMTGSADNYAKLWDAKMGKLIDEYRVPYSHIVDAVWDNTSRRVALATWDYGVYILDVEKQDMQFISTTKNPKKPSDTDGRANTLAWDSTGRYLVIGTTNFVVQLWDVEKQVRLKTFIGHQHRVSQVIFDPTDKFMVTVGLGTICIWDVNASEVIRTLEVTGNLHVNWSEHGLHLLYGARSRTCRVWDITHPIPAQFLPAHGDMTTGLGWRADGLHLATSAYGLDETIKIWDVNTGIPQILNIGGQVTNDLVWDKTDTRLATVMLGGTAKIWDVDTGACLATFTAHIAQHRITGIDWDADGGRVFTISDDWICIIWDANTAEKRHILSGHRGAVHAVAWNGITGQIATGSSDKTVKIWDGQTGKCCYTLTGHDDKVNVCAWSADWRFLATGSSDTTVWIWDGQTGNPIKILMGHTRWIAGVAWHPSGAYLATSSGDSQVWIWDVETEIYVAKVIMDAVVTRVAWSPDGAFLAMSCWDGRVIWVKVQIQ